MEVRNIAVVRDAQGFMRLEADINGKRAAFPHDLNRDLLQRYGIVFLGSAFEERHFFDLPADREAGQPAQRLRGFTNNAAVVSAVRAFVRAIDEI